MFKLFGKKKATEPPAREKAPEQGAEFKALAAEFLAEEFDIMAVTGPNGFVDGKLEGETLWTAAVALTAWREEDGPIHREPAWLLALADDTLMKYLRRQARGDSIIQARVRPSEDGKRFLLVDLPQPVMEPELKAILEEQKKPVSTWVPGLGTFTLVRGLGWFEAEVDWLGRTVRLDIDQEEDWEACVASAKALLGGAGDWDRRVRELAADQLLSQANDWAGDALEDGDEIPAVTPEDFLVHMELDAIQVSGDGGLKFWFNDEDLFFGRAVCVTGSLSAGPLTADFAN